MEKKNNLPEVLGEKSFDAGNLALAALVFGSFLTERPIKWTTLFLGLLFWIVFYLVGIWLYSGGED